MTKLLSKDNIKQILSIKDTIDILEKAFSDLANDKVSLPQRTQISIPSNKGIALFMPAHLEGMGALGTKTVTVFNDNIDKYNLPSTIGTITILDDKTGAPLSIMDGSFLTAMRTGGVAGLATKFLAREDAKIHTLFGSGGMAKTHALAVSAVRDIEKLCLCSLDPVDVKESFKESLEKELDCEIIIADNPESAVNNSDIVTLITSAKNPIIKYNWIKKGAHINGIGAHGASVREIDSESIVNSKVYCDLESACRIEAGDLIIPIENNEWNWDQLAGELGDLITGKFDVRFNEAEITVFKSVGLAIQDISVAFHTYQQAIEKKIGTDFSF